MTVADVTRAIDSRSGRTLGVRAVLGFGTHGLGLGVWSEQLDKVLRQIHPDASFTASGLAVMNDFVTDVLRRLVCTGMKSPAGEYLVTPIAGEVPALLACTAALQDPSRLICQRLDPALGLDSEAPPRKVTAGVLTVQAIESAVRSILPGELVKYAVSEGTKAVAHASGAPPPGSSWPGDDDVWTGIIFDVAAVAAASSKLSNGMATLTGEAAVFLAAVAEYLAAELLELSGNAARDCRSNQISPRHINLAIRGDEELVNLMAGAVVRDGGVVPHIHKFLLPTGADKKETGPDWESAQPKCERDLEIVRQYRKAHPWTSPAPPAPADFAFVYPEEGSNPISWAQRFGDMLEQAPDGLLVDPTDGRHHMLTAGSNDGEEEAAAVRRPAPQFDQGTLGSQQLAALELLSAEDRATFDRRVVSQASLLEGIRAAQSDTRRIIAADVFRRLSEEGTVAFHKNVHFTAEALQALQSAVEDSMTKLLEEANLVAITAKRFCIEPEDLQLARRIRGGGA